MPASEGARYRSQRNSSPGHPAACAAWRDTVHAMMAAEAAEVSEKRFLFFDSDDDYSLEGGPAASPPTQEEEGLDAAGTADAAPAQAGGNGQPFRKRSRKRGQHGDTRFSSKPKQQQQRQLSIEELAALVRDEVALSCDLPHHKLGEYEEGVLNDDINEEMYFQVQLQLAAPVPLVRCRACSGFACARARL